LLIRIRKRRGKGCDNGCSFMAPGVKLQVSDRLKMNLPVPHPFAFFLVKEWETTKAKRTNSCGQRPSANLCGLGARVASGREWRGRHVIAAAEEN
jgi:hypothetical protein